MLALLTVLLSALSVESRPRGSIPHASVILSRHCVRTAESDWYCMGNYTGNPQAYSAKEWPVFPAPAMTCTPRGMEIVSGQGENYYPTLPTPINFIADNMTRDIQTSQAYAAGMGITCNLTVNGALFNPTDYGVCPPIPTEEANAAVEAWLAVHPWTPQLQALLVEVQTIMGQGTEPLLQDITNVVQDGLYTGGQCGGSEAAEAFLLELEKGSNVGWGLVNPGQLEEMLQLQVYNMWLENSGAIGQSEHSNLLWAVRNSIENYINGNDLAGFGNLLNLSWQQPGYPFDTTNPGSALRFDVWDDNGEWTVELWHVGTQFYTTEGNLSVTPVHVGWSHSNSFTFSAFDQAVQSVVDWACVQKTIE